MTKPLNKQEKQRRKKERKEATQARRREKRKEKEEERTKRKAAEAAQAEAMKKAQDQPHGPHLSQDQGQGQGASIPLQVHLCDSCAYEFGECEGKPQFASEEGADDRVVQCEGYVSVEVMPTADEIQKKGGPPQEPPVRKKPESSDKSGKKPEISGKQRKKEDPKKPRFIPAGPQDRGDPKRFQEDEDYGACASCNMSLKRTAHSRYQDAVRCTNPRCRSYRAVVKLLSTGVK